jgi:hypothetical protein
MTHNLFALLEEAPELFLDEIQEWLAVAHDTGSALHSIIHDCGLTYKVFQRAAAERDDDWREEWMEDMRMCHIGRQLVMVDETSKDDQMIYRHYGYVPAGCRVTIHANFMRGEHYSMVAALSMDGYEAMAVVPGSVDRENFYDFIVDDVVSFLFFVIFE